MNRQPASCLPRIVQRGFTLVELLITIAILVIGLAIGVPSFKTTVASTQLSSQTNEFVAAVQTARAEAIRRNRNVVLCRSDNGSSCTAGSSWAGWLIFEDSDGNAAVGGTEEVIKTGTFATALTVKVSPAISTLSDTIRFLPTGMARGSTDTALLTATVTLCAPVTGLQSNVRDVQIAFGGRTAVKQRGTGGSCTAAPTDS